MAITTEDLQSKIILTNTADKDVSVSTDGLFINYDKSTVPKNFSIASGGVSWTDGVLNFNTGLGRLASIQEAFQAVQLPPNAFTLKLNDSLLLTDGITDSAVHSKTQSLITDGNITSTITKDTLTMEYIDTGVATANINVITSPNVGNIDVSFVNAGGVSSETFIKSQLNQTEITAIVSDPINGFNSLKQEFTIAGAILKSYNTSETGASTANYTSQCGAVLGCNTNQQFITSSNQTTEHTSTVNGSGTNLTSQTSTSSYQTNFNGASSSSGSSVGANYETLSGSIFTNNGAINVNGGGSEVLVSAVNVSGASSQLLRLQTPLSGDAILEHNSPSGGRNLGISSTGNILMTADNMDVSQTRLIFPTLVGNYMDFLSTTGKLTLNQTTTGGGGNPMIQLNQANTSAGAGSIQFYKNTSTSGVGIGELSFQAKDAGNTQREYGRINATIRNTGAGNQDGSFSFQALVNNSLTELIRVNGADSQVEFFQPIDLNNNAIVSSIGNVSISALNSANVGDVLITAKNDATITATNGNVNIVSNGAGDAINLTSVSSVNIEATGDNLTLTAGSLMVLDSAVIDLVNTNTTTSTPNHNADIKTTSNGVETSTFLKLQLNGGNIWVPYFTTDPSL
jgi:hypothetical protein